MNDRKNEYYRVWVKSYRRTRRGRGMFKFSNALLNARQHGDLELVKALLAARRKVDHAGDVDTNAILRRLQRGIYRPKTTPIETRVAAKRVLAAQLRLDFEKQLTAEELKWLRHTRTRRPRYKNGKHYERPVRHDRRWKRIRQYDNILQRAKQAGRTDLVAELKRERILMGGSWKVDIVAVRRRLGYPLGKLGGE